MKRFLPGILFFGMGSIFPIVGWVTAEIQRRDFDALFPVPAEVVSHQVLVGADEEDGKHFRPGLKLRFLADGMPAEGEGLFEQDGMSTEAFTEDQLARFPVGAKVTAWADPRHLEAAYLVREASPIPYLIVLFPMVFVSTGAMFLLFPPGEGKVYTPGTPWAGRTWLLTWDAMGVAAAIHYFRQPGAWNAFGVALFAVYLGIGIVPLLFGLRRKFAKT